MYGKSCYILLIFGISCSKASHIEDDTAPSPFRYRHDREIEFETADTEFSYQINLSILSDLNQEYKTINKICEFTPHYGKFYETLFYKRTWNKISQEKFPEKNLIKWEPTIIRALKARLHKFRTENKTEIKCNHLSFLTDELAQLNTEFSKLKNSIFTTISNIVPEETILKHTRNYTAKTNLTNALDFSHWFIYNFYRYTRISFKLGKNNAFLTINIPLYSHVILSRIYQKPILYKNIAYLSNSRAQFIIESQIGRNYFTDFEHDCFYANNKTFCKKPTHENDCDNKYISQSSNKFDEKCFNRLPFQNIITQIKNDIYFLVIDPMSIDLICNIHHQTIRLFQPSKMLNNECTIKSTFFTFDKNSTKDYGIYFSNITTISQDKFDTNTLIYLYCIFIFLFLYMIFISSIIFYYYKLYALRRSPDYLESRNYLESPV